MGYFEGLLAGFGERKSVVEAENLRQSELAMQREGRIYEALLASPDPEIQSLAAAGLLESAKPQKRKKGIRGWLGEMEASPFLPQIQQLIATPVPVTEQVVTPGLPSRQTTGYIGTIPEPTRSMAQAETSPTQGGPMTQPQPAPQPTDIAPFPATGSVTKDVAGPAVGRVDEQVAMQPRQVFASPEQQALQAARGQARGSVEGEVAGLVASGMTEVEARALVAAKYRRAMVGTTPFQSITGEIVNPDGSTTPAFAVLDRAGGTYLDPITREPLTNFRPRPTGAQTERFGQLRESLSRELFGTNFRDLEQHEVSVVMDAERQQIQDLARRRSLGTEQGQYQAPIDVSTAARTGARVGTTSQQYENQRVGTQQQQARRIAATDIRQQLSHIRGLLGPLPSKTELSGLAPGAAVAARRRLPAYRESFAQLESAINNIRASLTRTMQSNVGTETERDAQRALTTLADIEGSLMDPLRGDTRESAQLRIDETIRYLDQIMQTMPGTPVPTGPAVGVPPPAAATTPTAPAGRAAPQGGLDAVVPGLYVDDQGNLIVR